MAARPPLLRWNAASAEPDAPPSVSIAPPPGLDAPGSEISVSAVLGAWVTSGYFCEEVACKRLVCAEEDAREAVVEWGSVSGARLDALEVARTATELLDGRCVDKTFDSSDAAVLACWITTSGPGEVEDRGTVT